MNRSLAFSKVLEPDVAEHLFGSLLPDMVQLALRASELCTKVTPVTKQPIMIHWSVTKNITAAGSFQRVVT